MFGQTFAVLALSAVGVLAHPKQHKMLHQRHHHPSGSGMIPVPTGVYPAGNSTNLFPTGSASSFGTSVPVVTAPVITMTVSPVPSLPSSASSAVSSQNAAASGSSDDSGDDSGDCSGPQTVTSTAIEYFTVTVGASGQSLVGGASSSAAAAPVAASSDSTPSSAGSPVLASANSAASSNVEAAAPSSTGAKAISAPAASASATGGNFFEQSGSSSASVLASSTAASSDASSSYSASSPPSSGGSKRGLAYNDASLTGAFQGKGMSWAYNWAGSTSNLASGIQFIPLLWGEKSFSSWNPPQSSALLSFNEPDEPGQANMDPKTAAAAHIKYMNPHASSTTRIGSPAVSNGNGVDNTGRFWGLDWLAEFFKECAGQCKVDFLAIHWYGTADQTKYFQQHIQNATSIASQEWGINSVWLTEFQPTGSPQQQADFLNENLPFLDQQAGVEKYAYYMVENGNLVNGDSISSPVGTTYCG
ncbi:MAG: hypothetical protein Q9160_001468 [Pyrenula sp. 1 TL-2023]